jgi:hypothetical protein
VEVAEEQAMEGARTPRAASGRIGDGGARLHLYTAQGRVRVGMR